MICPIKTAKPSLFTVDIDLSFFLLDSRRKRLPMQYAGLLGLQPTSKQVIVSLPLSSYPSLHSNNKVAPSENSGSEDETLPFFNFPLRYFKGWVHLMPAKGKKYGILFCKIIPENDLKTRVSCLLNLPWSIRVKDSIDKYSLSILALPKTRRMSSLEYVVWIQSLTMIFNRYKPIYWLMVIPPMECTCPSDHAKKI